MVEKSGMSCYSWLFSVLSAACLVLDSQLPLPCRYRRTGNPSVECLFCGGTILLE